MAYDQVASVLTGATDAARAATGTAPQSPRARVHTVRAIGLIISAGVLGVIFLLSIWLGSKDIAFTATWDVLWHNDGSQDALIIHAYRIPRTLLGVLVGAALGVSGALMQALTRNALADPGLLGVNMGASTGVVAGLTVFGVSSVLGYVWFAFAGAALAAVAVYALGSTGRGVATPERLVLAGAALTAVLYAIDTAALLMDPEAFDEFRFWNVGSLAGRYYEVLLPVLPFIVVGLAIALLLARPLNAMAMGEAMGQALGVRPGRVRLLGAIAVTLLCGAATAAAGPVAFVGLAVPHIARLIVGPDQRWVLVYSLVLSPILLVGSDVVGRMIAPPSEVQVGIVTAAIGVPVFVALCRQRKLVGL
ncbi:iron chelate uptake ABC transporter family permease subunit [Saccharopolyspora sp. K220]|uniref:FecCD family ABC transporter permease n=1 Tax=Saccharopolyspora soli TaxID=2926618 RepID=UPI001F59A690|nr:iron chelate uptake ABC transporter family permease subunit [Saccharopolyspora soli]MCI2417443.1 iron chelate uptake ABC transporter family permease subunit [Saccharopolyspora soli]